jgi:hypothetical protein
MRLWAVAMILSDAVSHRAVQFVEQSVAEPSQIIFSELVPAVVWGIFGPSFDDRNSNTAQRVPTQLQRCSWVVADENKRQQQ